MKASKIIISIFMISLCLSSLFLNVEAADVKSIKISFFDGVEQMRFSKPVFIAGLWQYVDITLDQTLDNFILRLYKGVLENIVIKNETNYYEWGYNKDNVIPWIDLSGYDIDYIKYDLCFKNNVTYGFCIGIKDTLPNIVDYCENWTLELYEDGNSLYSKEIVIEKLKTGISISKPALINFYVDPFTEMDVQGNEFFKIGNVGNIILSIDIDYEKYANIFQITNFNKNLSLDEVNTYYVNLHSKSWPPGIREIKVEGVGSYPKSYFIDTNATVTLYSSFVIDIPLFRIYVGHSNYTINEILDTSITFQYLEKLNMYEDEIKDIKVYVSGDGVVNLDIWADEENIRVLKIFDGNTEISPPFAFTSTNTSERTIIIKVEAISEGKTGILNYKLTNGVIIKTYNTKIIIGPPVSQNKENFTNSDLILKIIVILLVFIVVIYMILSYVKHKRR